MDRFCIVCLLLGLLAGTGFAQDSEEDSGVDPQERRVIAVLDLDMASGVPESYQRPLSDRLRQELFNTGEFTVVERNSMKEIMDEQGLQMAGCTSNECAIEVGRLLGVRWIIAGSLGQVGQTYTVNLRMIDVQTSEILKAESVDCACSIDRVLTSTLGQAAREMAEKRQTGPSRDIRSDTKEPDDTGVWEEVPMADWRWWTRTARRGFYRDPGLERNYGLTGLKAGGGRYGLRLGWLRESGGSVALELSAGSNPKPILAAITLTKRWFGIWGIEYAPQIGLGYDFRNEAPVLRYNLFAFEVDLSRSMFLRVGVDIDRLLGDYEPEGHVDRSDPNYEEVPGQYNDWMIQVGWKI